MTGITLIVLLFTPSILCHFFIVDVGKGTLVSASLTGLLIAAFGWNGSLASFLSGSLGGSLVGLGPALLTGFVYQSMGSEKRRQHAQRQLNASLRRREAIGAWGAVAIGLTCLAGLVYNYLYGGKWDVPEKALLGVGAFLVLGLGVLLRLYLTKSKGGDDAN